MNIGLGIGLGFQLGGGNDPFSLGPRGASLTLSGGAATLIAPLVTEGASLSLTGGAVNFSRELAPAGDALTLSGGDATLGSDALSSLDWYVVVADRDGSNNLVDGTGGGRTLSLPGGSANPTLLDHTGTDYIWFPGTTGNNLSIAGLSNSTTYDYTVTYLDTTTDTGSETTDGSGNLVFGNTQVNFSLEKVTKIEVEPSGGGALVADVRATSANPDATTFTELIAARTVTINRSSTGYKTAVVDQPQYAFAVDDYLSAADDGFWNIGATQDFTAGVVVRTHGAGGAVWFYMAHGRTSVDGWGVGNSFGQKVYTLINGDSSGSTSKQSTTNRPNHTLDIAALVRDTNADTIGTYQTSDGIETTTDGTSGALVDDAYGLRVGSDESGSYMNAIFVGAFLKKSAMTASEIDAVRDALITANGGTP